MVVQLLQKMGYGSFEEEKSSRKARVTSRTHDGGIDGIIPQDKLGLDSVYVQAKRWKESTVQQPDIHQFVGALGGKKARKGVFITTASFSKGAREFVDKFNDKTVVLIDGVQLAELMIDHNLGVKLEDSFELKKIDSDYFIEDSEL